MSEYKSLWEAFLLQWKDIAIAVGVSMLSGAAASLHRWRRNSPTLFSLVEFMADTLLAGIAGFIMLMWCIELELSPWYIGGLVGIVGHSAPRFLFFLERALLQRAEKALGANHDSH